jgi:type IV pilus assembly protein PilM
MLASLRDRLPSHRPSQTFGLDIGSAAVKVIQLRRVAASYMVTRCAAVALPIGAVAEGTITDTGAAVEAIRTAVGRAGITSTQATVGICGRELIIKKLQIPQVPHKELRDAIRIEAEHQIPFAVDEVFLDYHVITQQNRLIDLTLVAAKKSKVMEYHTVVRQAGLDPIVVDVDGFALGNHLEVSGGAERERMALVDIGATMTKVAIVAGSVTHFVRDVPFGGSRYTHAIATRLGIPFDRAEALKTGADRRTGAAVVARTCQAISRDLGREIQRTLDYHAESDVTATHVVRILLVGGGAMLEGLDETLTSTLGLPVQIARPFDTLAVDPACADTISSVGPALTLALGLSLRRRADRASV